MTDRDRLYLEHILVCLEKIERYTEGGRSAFFERSVVQDAVVRSFQADWRVVQEDR